MVSISYSAGNNANHKKVKKLQEMRQKLETLTFLVSFRRRRQNLHTYFLHTKLLNATDQFATELCGYTYIHSYP